MAQLFIPLSQGKECSMTWYENTATTYSKILNGPKAVLVGLLSAIFIHSETWRSIVIKTGSLGLVAKPVCTITSMEVWFSANVIGRETASARVRHALAMNALIYFYLDAKGVRETTRQPSRPCANAELSGQS